MNAETLVVELFTEELPPKALKRLGEAFSLGLFEALRASNLVSEQSVPSPFSTPRRLAVAISHVRPMAEDSPVSTKLLPDKQVQESGGAASSILANRLAKIGREAMAAGYPDAWIGPDHLYVQSDGKADYVWLSTMAKGSSLAAGLQAALDSVIGSLPVPKMMSYQRSDGSTVRFARPAHRLLALHGSEVVAVSALGLNAGRITEGHRFASRGAVEIASAGAYEATLAAEGKVIASFDERRRRIEASLVAAAAEEAGPDTHPIMPDALLDEVTALVEWPAVYAGRFDPAYLDVPQECLILTMQQNQRYFALAGNDGKLRSSFLLVSNIETPHAEVIVRGNERVLRARLADAKFFFDQDRKQRLDSRIARLEHIVYHNKLYSQGERVRRLARLAGEIAIAIGTDPTAAKRAALLAKADLVTDMVGEFPELQGLMGRYYAEHDGESPVVAAAIEQHYWPRFAGDELPRTAVAQSAALAIAEMFGIGNVPTGDKDPFGLRRAALGVLRILMEARLALSLDWLVELSFAALSDIPAVRPKLSEVMTFFVDRLRATLREQGYTANEVEAVLSLRPARIDLIPAQMEAIRSFGSLPEAEALAAANKRIGNILRKSDHRGETAIDRSLLSLGAERDLYTAVEALLPVVRTHVERGDYTQALQALASARGPVDRFFDDVMVMAEDPALRANRLALLRELSAAMNQVADISKLAV